MSIQPQLRVDFNDQTTTENTIWLTLEQQAFRRSQNNADLVDMVRMVAQAAAGGSAREYQLAKCAAARVGTDGSLIVTLHVYVWPHPLTLSYNMYSSAGAVSAGRPVELVREIDVAVEGSDTITLPWIVGPGTTAEWQLPPVNAFSEPLEDAPEVTIADATITLSAACYGVLRLRGPALGFIHRVTMRFAKGLPPDPSLFPVLIPPEERTIDPTNTTMIDIGHALVKATATVSAAFIGDSGETETEFLTLEIPPCVLDLLEYCVDETLKVARPSSFIVDPDQAGAVVYYDTCTGRVLELRYEDLPEEDRT